MRIATEETHGRDDQHGDERSHGRNELQCPGDTRQQHRVRGARQAEERGIKREGHHRQDHQRAQILGKQAVQVLQNLMHQQLVLLANAMDEPVAQRLAVLDKEERQDGNQHGAHGCA